MRHRHIYDKYERYISSTPYNNKIYTENMFKKIDWPYNVTDYLLRFIKIPFYTSDRKILNNIVQNACGGILLIQYGTVQSPDSSSNMTVRK